MSEGGLINVNEIVIRNIATRTPDAVKAINYALGEEY